MFIDRRDFSFRGSTRGHFQAIKVADPTQVSVKEAFRIIARCDNPEILETWIAWEQLELNRKTVLNTLISRLNGLKRKEGEK